ncbi:acyl-CoA dehydrogenase [Nocardioides sp. GXQ0305]|uniref:acyl-CoA dehydrogenase n=1 Tax=Nocardioides sp. GXQ0305 TaxID=3423912 RepID=UPI003D7E19BB
MQPHEVRIGREGPRDARVTDAVRRLAGDGRYRRPGCWPDAARDLGAVLPPPGRGRTGERWSVLATLGAHDLQLARAVEPHVDALAILEEADAAGHDGVPVPGATWGVYAAEGPGVRVDATPVGAGWRLSGTKPWCSLADRLSHALVTAWVDDEQRGLFAVELTARGVGTSAPDEWSARGLRDVVSLPVTLTDVPARPIGPPGWYLARDGFAWGGLGVAAVWYGGAVGLARRLAQPRSRPRDQVAHLLLGEVDQRLAAARAVLHRAAADVDAGCAAGVAGALLAHRARAVVASSCEAVLTAVDHDLGPGPLVGEPDHAARVADLRLYLRQHHAERDLAELGRLVAEQGHPW